MPFGSGLFPCSFRVRFPDGPVQRGLAHDDVHERADAQRLRVHERVVRPQELARRREPGPVPIADDALALAGLLDGLAADGLARARGVEPRQRRSDLDANPGLEPVPFGPRALGGEGRFAQPRLVRAAREQVPAHLRSDEPRRRAIAERAAVQLQPRLQRDLRQQGGFDDRALGQRQLALQGGPPQLRPRADRRGLERARIRRLRGRRRHVRQGVGALEVDPHQLVQLDARDRLVALGADLPLAHLGELHVDCQHVRVRLEPSVTPPRRAAQVLVGRGHGGVGRVPRRLRLEHLAVGARRGQRQIRREPLAIKSRDRLADPGGLDRRRRPGAIEDRLLDGEHRAEVVGRVRVVERVDAEVLQTEPALREERAEDEDRLIASLPRLDDVDPWEVAGPGLLEPLGRLLAAGLRCPHGRVVHERHGDRLRERQGFLGRTGGRPEEREEENERRLAHAEVLPFKDSAARIRLHPIQCDGSDSS